MAALPVFPSRACPPTLKELTAARAALLIVKGCERFSKMHPQLLDNVDSQLWMQPIHEMQEYCLRKILPLWGEICSVSRVLLVAKSRRTACDIDVRILLSGIMYENMKELKIRRSIIAEPLVPQVSQFVRGYLPRLVNLSLLDVSGIAIVDDDLAIVSQRCQDTLGEIRFSTDVGAITEPGLMHLARCSNLRTIVDTCSLVSFSVAAVARLVCLVPALEHINASGMAEVLDEAMRIRREPLALKSVVLSNVGPADMALFAEFCPSLEDISLEHWSNEATAALSLANSRLSISSLSLRYFTYNADVKLLLAKKGSHLRTLVLYTMSPMDVFDVDAIGRACMNLTSLELVVFDVDYEAISRRRAYNPSPGIFSKLVSFKIAESVMDDGDLIMCLAFARDLRVMDFSGLRISLRSMTDRKLMKLHSVNPFAHLKVLKVNCRSNRLTLCGLLEFYTAVPSLNCLLFSTKLFNNNNLLSFKPI